MIITPRQGLQFPPAMRLSGLSGLQRLGHIARYGAVRTDQVTMTDSYAPGDAISSWIREAGQAIVPLWGMTADMINPAAAEARRAQEVQLQQAIAAAAGYQSQASIEASQSQATIWKWAIGGVAIIGGGLVFAKLLGRNNG